MSALAEPSTSPDLDALLRGSPRPQGRELANRLALSGPDLDSEFAEEVRAELLTQLEETRAEMVPGLTGGGEGKRARRAERRNSRLSDALAQLGDNAADGPSTAPRESSREDREAQETVRLIEAAFSAAPLSPTAEVGSGERPPLPADQADRRTPALGAAESPKPCAGHVGGAERLLLLALAGVNGVALIYLALAHPFAAQVVVLAGCAWVLRGALAQIGRSSAR